MSSSANLAEVGKAKPEKIALALEHEIRAGILKFGEQLESESQLVRRFAVSRMTVRKGLEALASKGLITTRIGIGSFVAFDGRVLNNALGWTRALASRDGDVKTRMLLFDIKEDPALARQFNIGGSKFIAIDRTRSIAKTNQVVSIERSRVPLRPELTHVPTHGLTDGSLQRTLRAAGLIGRSGEEWAEVVCLEAADARIMSVKVGAACLRTRRLVRDRKGQVLEYVVSLLDPRHFTLHLEF
jgi:GntR family transcriptional regulator